MLTKQLFLIISGKLFTLDPHATEEEKKPAGDGYPSSAKGKSTQCAVYTMQVNK